MIWIKDIWGLFFEECEKPAYIDYYTEDICFSSDEHTIEIPRVFNKTKLLREYIELFGTKSFKYKAREMPDDELRRLFHYLVYSDDDFAKQWILYGRKKVFDYAESWCKLNNFKCSKKEDDEFFHFNYLSF